MYKIKPEYKVRGLKSDFYMRKKCKWHAPSFVAQQQQKKNFEQQTFSQMVRRLCEVKQIPTNKKPKMIFFLKDEGR